ASPLPCGPWHCTECASERGRPVSRLACAAAERGATRVSRNGGVSEADPAAGFDEQPVKGGRAATRQMMARAQVMQATVSPAAEEPYDSRHIPRLFLSPAGVRAFAYDDRHSPVAHRVRCSTHGARTSAVVRLRS